MRFSRVCFILAMCVLVFACSAFGIDFRTELEKAKRGDADAQFYVGAMYYGGVGVKQDYKMAREYYEKAAAMNNALAINGLGVLYRDGNGVKQDYKKAREYFEKAAAMNNVFAFCNLGQIYLGGYGVKQDYKKAREYYEKAAAMNERIAFNNLGLIYKSGYGVKQDYKKARQYYEKAASMNEAAAFNNLGVMYCEGLGVKQDYKKAREYYKKAASMNNVGAIYNLGVMYYEGLGVKQDYKKARQYYEKVGAFNDLGYMCEHGKGVKQDYKKARQYYEKAASMNHALAIYNLGRMHENGLGIREDIKKAVEFYQQAAANGNEQAKKALARLKVPQKSDTKTIKQTPPKSGIDAMLASLSILDMPRVAVLAFEDKSEEGKAPSAAIIDMMTTELHKSGVFRLVEREYINSIINAKKLNQSNQSAAQKLGRIVGAQYIMVGSITLCSYNERASGIVIPVLGTAAKAKTAYVTIDIRLIDAESGEIVYANYKTGEATNKGTKSIGRSEKAVEGLLSLAVRNSVEKHVSSMKVLALTL